MLRKTLKDFYDTVPKGMASFCLLGEKYVSMEKTDINLISDAGGRGVPCALRSLIDWSILRIFVNFSTIFLIKIFSKIFMKYICK